MVLDRNSGTSDMPNTHLLILNAYKQNIFYFTFLRLNIIRKNYPLLRDSICAYYNQIKKAIDRDDYVNINHRLAEFFASYFDIIFAINRIPHPGEKKLVSIVNSECKLKPNNFEQNVENILLGKKDHLLEELNKLIDNLDDVLNLENIYFKK